MINILINGCNGRMGREISKLIINSQNFNLIGGISHTCSSSNSFKSYSSIKQVPQLPDVIIDFSTPLSSLKILNQSICYKIPIVIGTTGFSCEENSIIANASQYIPIFKSSNMSCSINILAHVIAKLSAILNEPDIEIIDKHHNKKKDSPSGTALLLADKINSFNNNKYTYNFNRFNQKKERSKNEIGFSSIRCGNTVGEHIVMLFSEDEVIEIKHSSISRKVFAVGALKAAKYIISKPTGRIYSMDDLVLDLF